MGALFVWALLSPTYSLAETVTVARVLDGDTLRLTDHRDIRLIGANAPELGKDGAPDQPLAHDAKRLIEKLVAANGNRVELDYDAERHDHYHRTLAYVTFADGRSAEEALLEAGLGFAIAIAPNVARIERFLAAEKSARVAKRGVWNDPYYAPHEAASITASDGGFHFVRGKVVHIGRSRSTIYLDITDNLSIAVPREYESALGGKPEHLLGRHILARGWIAVHGNRKHLQLSHASMLEVLD
jgi:endonuclease YncB( thermonuclease family)